MELNQDKLAVQMLGSIMQFHKIRVKQHNSHGQKRSELMVLLCIKRSGQTEIKVSEISSRLHVKTPTVTQLINELEAKGQIDRITNTNDRRAVWIRLTDEGKRVSEEAEQEILIMYRGLVNRLGETESLHLIELLNKVFDYFSEKE